MQQPIVFFFLVVVGFVAGAPRTDERIVGGIPVTPDLTGETIPFPYVVSIEYNRNHICGGFIYNPKWIVTTASCMENVMDINKLTVVAGQVNLIDIEVTEERHEVISIIPFERYNVNTRKHNIALIELTTPMTLDTYARNFIRFNEVYVDETLTPTGTFMGWGATFAGGASSPRLRYAEVTIVENDPVCGAYALDEFTISTMICATNTPSSTFISPCTFDGGSPLVQTYFNRASGNETTIVVGVLSRFSPTCDPAEPSVFTRLSVYYAWLYNNAGDQVYATA